MFIPLTVGDTGDTIELNKKGDLMRRLAAFIFVIMFSTAGWLCADEGAAKEEEAISHGDFSVLLLKAALGYTDTLPDTETALELVKGYGLVPEDWQVDTGLTHGELAEVLQRFGVVYLPADVDQPASRPFVEAMLRRELSRLRDYLARRLGHGFSVNHVLDQGVDRAVSPSTFD